MPSLSNWLPRQAASEPVPGSSPLPVQTYYPRARDPNAPDHRLQITSKCIYERQLPGGSYITAHVERLQSGYYDSPVIAEDCINNVRFLAIRFVFHEVSTERRFKSAAIRLTVHDENLQPEGLPLPPQIDHPSNNDTPIQAPRQKPKFLRHAPHLLYGAMSPETLDWNFNLAGSLGVAQTPVSASINPSGGVKSSYKIYKMMKIQGSIRSNSSWYGKHYDIEDGELVWTLEENELQKSGLPREFTFVMMLTKGDDANDVRFEMDIKTEVAAWFGSYPQWYTHLLKYQPLHKDPLNLDIEIGQKFSPCDRRLGFNFAGLMSTFDDFVTLPGTLYSTTDWSAAAQGQPPAGTPGNDQSKQKQQPQPQSSGITQSPTQVDQKEPENLSNTLHLRIHLDQAHKQGHTLSADYAKPESASKSRRSPQPTATPSPPRVVKAEASPKSASNSSKVSKQVRRNPVNSGLMPTPPKYKTSRVTPLQTHFEEQPPKPQTKAASDSEDTDQDYIPSFPESLPSPPPPSSQKTSSFSSHRYTKSSSTGSSAAPAPAAHETSPAPAANTNTTSTNAALTSHPSLRRTRSRSGLRKASLHSEPEDEEAISAAMDMLSGSPPPPAPAPPRSAPATSMIPSDDVMLATPRTRATLADLLEVEQAENARVQRRNGTLNTETKRQSGDLKRGRTFNSGHLMSRSRERDNNREKRYSMPIKSTGIGYPSASGNFNSRSSEGKSGTGGTERNSDGQVPIGNGRSSLMIPVGSKRNNALDIKSYL